MTWSRKSRGASCSPAADSFTPAHGQNRAYLVHENDQKTMKTAPNQPKLYSTPVPNDYSSTVVGRSALDRVWVVCGGRPLQQYPLFCYIFICCAGFTKHTLFQPAALGTACTSYRCGILYNHVLLHVYRNAGGFGRYHIIEGTLVRARNDTGACRPETCAATD